MKLKNELQNYGLTSHSIRIFGDSASPEMLDYLDLVEPRKIGGTQELFPNGVAESQGHPLLFFVNESRLSQTPGEKDEKLGHLRRMLACRGDRAYLARVRPGELLVTAVSLSDRPPEWKLYRAGTGEALTFFSRLALGNFDGEGEPDDADFVFKEMFTLLDQGADRLARILGRANVLSLIGRALFFRFLCDRHIVTERDVNCIAPKANGLLACFDNAENAYATSQWLDRTFNGDFLPLKDGGNQSFFNSIAERYRIAFSHLSAIVRGLEPVGAEDYQTKMKFKWSDFDFAHIPVGLLSQVYEAFCWKWEHRSAKETSVHYTPRRIAATLVDEAFDGLSKAHMARMLDPACGAGVFLVLAFRRLYRERWISTGQRPDTKAIRVILEKQLCGFDISDSALRLSALSLYLTAIELDPEPIPPEKLRFKVLNDLVLFNHRRPEIDPDDGPAIGSLGKHIGTQFDGQFDLVLSNPPWTSLPKQEKKLAAELTLVSREVIERKGNTELAHDYQNPDFAPDLPFLWRSTEWCKAGGRIAMALPARILLKQEDIPRRARETMFQLIEVTGIINGSNLSDTEVWPKMGQPFLLFFARNQRPQGSTVIQLITPFCDTVLNRKGEVRIDSKSMHPVEIRATFDEPWIWKALAIGTLCDIEVTRKMKSAVGKPLDLYWKKELKLASGKGYQVVEAGTQRPAFFLEGLPNLDSTDTFRFLVQPEHLLKFKRKTVCWPRNEAIYKAPLTLVKEAPGIDRTHGWALLSHDDIGYNESFCGYSAAGHPEGELLACYLHLFVHSLPWIHYVLMTSAKFGAERRRFYKADLDECPIVPLDKLTTEQKHTIRILSRRLITENMNVFSDIDAFFAALYGLDTFDLEVVRDTLDVCLPYDESRERACRVPTGSERETFRRRLESILRPFFKVLGKEPQVVLWKPDDQFLQQKAPFGIMLIYEQGSSSAEPDTFFRDVILQMADDTGTTRIIQRIEGGLLVGILSQYRYWTSSRARLLGAELVRQHISVFEE
ncbi:MAG: N-6 DNA methylase [bacterium]